MFSRLFSRSMALKRRALGTSAALDATKLRVVQTAERKPRKPKEQLSFGKDFTDHMLEIEWTETDGWHAPTITPFHSLQLSPAASSLHYALQCFEGMKAYKDAQGRIRLFRPEMNMKRMNNSMQRLTMPSFDGDELIKLLGELLKLEECWIPEGDGYSVYIRPSAISTTNVLGLAKVQSVLLYAILCPAGGYFANGFKGVKLLADTENIRAWPGGVGHAKLGANYGPTVLPGVRGFEEKGAAQVLWLFGEDHLCTEAGTSNVFFVIENAATRRLELITPPLSRGDILPGVTRDSILTLASGSDSRFQYDDVHCVERDISMSEILQASKEGRLKEGFGAGTAAVVTPISAIFYKDEEIVFPTGEGAGPISTRLFNDIMDIQYGRIEHEWSHIVE